MQLFSVRRAVKRLRINMACLALVHKCVQVVDFFFERTEHRSLLALWQRYDSINCLVQVVLADIFLFHCVRWVLAYLAERVHHVALEEFAIFI